MFPALIVKLAIKGLNHPATKTLAKSIMTSVKSGNIAKAEKQASILKTVFNKGISRVKGLTTEVKPLSKSVNLRRELYYNPHTQTAGKGYFGDFKKTPMIDIDLPKGAHFARNIVHESKDKALKNLFSYLKTPEGKKSLFATYDTPGGIRMWDLSRRMSPKKFYKTGISKRLGDDPSYGMYNMRRGGFGTRLSPKPGRQGDYVARFVDYFGEGKAIPRNVTEVKKYHDDLIKKVVESSTKENINIGGLFDLIGK
jgi:hypothetical protein